MALNLDRCRALRLLLFGLAILSLDCRSPISSYSAVITVDASTSYQTITGWEATAGGGEDEDPGRSYFPQYQNQLIEAALDLGINRLRVGIPSGIENDVDWYGRYMNGEIPRDVWRKHRYEITNDNDDAFVSNGDGFKWSRLDHKIEQIVLPLKRGLESRGETLFVNANYTAFISNNAHQTNPEEYAEFVLATYQHMQSKYGFVPDAWEVILEPDNDTPWTGTDIGRAIVAAGNLLKKNGFTPRFIAPSTMDMAKASAYFDEMMQVHGVSQFLSELSYHRYDGVSDENLQLIAQRAKEHGVTTSMLEWIGATHNELHSDLKKGMNSAWQQYVLGHPFRDNGAQYFVIDVSDAKEPKVKMGERTRFLRQYFKYVRAGATRVFASSDNALFDPIAFKNTNGKYVVIVSAKNAGDFRVTGLPAGTYQTSYVTARKQEVPTLTTTMSEGQILHTTIPASGVLTIHQLHETRED